MLLYPNPVNDRLTIVAPEYREQEVQISLYDANGRVVLEQRVAEWTSTQIDLREYKLSAGMYVVRLTSKDGVVSTKSFIKIAP